MGIKQTLTILKKDNKFQLDFEKLETGGYANGLCLIFRGVYFFSTQNVIEKFCDNEEVQLIIKIEGCTEEIFVFKAALVDLKIVNSVCFVAFPNEEGEYYNNMKEGEWNRWREYQTN